MKTAVGIASEKIGSAVSVVIIAATLRTNQAVQAELGAGTRMMTPSEIVEIPIEAKVDGPTWGLGGSLVGGYSHFFGMVDVNYTWTDISAFDDYITKLVASARVGIQGKVWRMSGALWVGSMYLNNEATIQITLPSNLPAPALNGALIEIDQESKDNFNFIFGGAWNITRHFQLTVEGGVGERDQFLVSLGTRF